MRFDRDGRTRCPLCKSERDAVRDDKGDRLCSRHLLEEGDGFCEGSLGPIIREERS